MRPGSRESVAEKGNDRMKPEESTAPANEHVRAGGGVKLALSARYREYYRIGLDIPGLLTADRAFAFRPGLRKRRLYPAKIVLTAVPFHDGRLPATGGEE